MHNNGKIFRPSVPVVLSPSVLPDEFQQCEFCAPASYNSSCKIDLGFRPFVGMHLNFTIQPLTDQYRKIIGSSDIFAFANYGYKMLWLWSDTIIRFSSLQNRNYFYNYDFLFDNGMQVAKRINLNDDITESVITNFNWLNSFESDNFCLFFQGSGYGCYFKLAFFEVENVCKLIPCYRKLDNVSGFYDVVRETFFYHSSLIHGADCTEVLQ